MDVLLSLSSSSIHRPTTIILASLDAILYALTLEAHAFEMKGPNDTQLATLPTNWSHLQLADSSSMAVVYRVLTPARSQPACYTLHQI
jgi:hypothetical protein